MIKLYDGIRLKYEENKRFGNVICSMFLGLFKSIEKVKS